MTDPPSNPFLCSILHAMPSAVAAEQSTASKCHASSSLAKWPSHAEATDLVGWLDLQWEGQVRARHDLQRADADRIFLQHGVGETAGQGCGWTGATEVLRTLLAFTALPIALSAS